jgi:hypothetical protein
VPECTAPPTFPGRTRQRCKQLSNKGASNCPSLINVMRLGEGKNTSHTKRAEALGILVGSANAALTETGYTVLLAFLSSRLIAPSQRTPLAGYPLRSAAAPAADGLDYLFTVVTK